MGKLAFFGFDIGRIMGKRGGVSSSVGSKEGANNAIGKANNKVFDFDVGLGLGMEANSEEESLTHHKRRLMLISQPYHHEPSQLSSSSSPSSSSSCGAGRRSCGPVVGLREGNSSGGPILYKTSNRVACLGDVYDAVGTASASATAASSDAHVAAASSRSQSFDPFDSINSSSSAAFTFKFNTSGGEMTPSVNVSVPFTAAQLQELERQTIIFKYIMASVPVPAELLAAISRTQSSAPPVQSNSLRGSLELGILSHNSDPEPWRCKRTDGKKWRCSRDVVPDQKYCERHSHKSRPRSRKHVESHSDSNLTTTTAAAAAATNSSYNSSSGKYIPSAPPLAGQESNFPHQLHRHFPMFPITMASGPSISSQARSLEWFLKGETVPVDCNSNREWHSSKGHASNYDGKAYNVKVQRRREEQFNPNEYLNWGDGHSFQTQWPKDQRSLSLSPKSASLEAALSAGQTQARETRHFIDAWSTALTENVDEMGNRCSASSGDKLLPSSSLTLSMPGRNETDREKEDADETSYGIMGSKRKGGGISSSQWMIPLAPESWMSSPPGGPLAEALILGMSGSTKAASNLTSPHDSGG